MKEGGPFFVMNVMRQTHHVRSFSHIYYFGIKPLRRWSGLMHR